MTVLAWVLAGVSLVAFLIALHVGESCASSVGPYCAGLFFASWLWLVYRYDRRGR